MLAALLIGVCPGPLVAQNTVPAAALHPGAKGAAVGMLLGAATGALIGSATKPDPSIGQVAQTAEASVGCAGIGLLVGTLAALRY